MKAATYEKTRVVIMTASFLFVHGIDNCLASPNAGKQLRRTYPIVDTNQTQCSGTQVLLTSCPPSGESGYGQDAQYSGLIPSYINHGNGTVTDRNTRLMWGNNIDTDRDGKISANDKLTYDQAQDYASSLSLGGYTDWRLPSIKELYSLIHFDGQDPSGIKGGGRFSFIPFINNDFFRFAPGDIQAGERLIDSQYVSSTRYVSTTMNHEKTVFGVNFIDGRIKGYGLKSPQGREKTFYVLVVRGNSSYGVNHFSDNDDGTITDHSTGLTWQQEDSFAAMNWPESLSYCENLTLAGKNDWRLPNVKELQSIVDYSKSPDTNGSAAIDDHFMTSTITNEAGQTDYPNYWSSTTHLNSRNAKNGAYVAFGRSMGKMHGRWMDVHGAGSQRSDPKEGDANKFAHGHGPQGDAVRINNFARCVSGGDAELVQQPKIIKRTPVNYALTGNEPSDAPGRDNRVQPGKAAPTKGNHFTLLDKNNDGKLSKTEARGPLSWNFHRIDQNNDGYISENELPHRALQR